MTPPLLDTDALLALLVSLLPRAPDDAITASSEVESSQDSRTAPTTTATLRHPSDALALLLHSVMIRLDFRLVGLSDSDRLPAPASSSSSSEEDAAPSNRLPSTWNSGAPEAYGFRYRHDQSSLDYLVKLTKMGDRIAVNGLALQGNSTSTLTVPLSDYLSSSYFPATLSLGDVGNAAGQLKGAFASPSRAQDLVMAFKNSIVVSLIPGLQKEGFEASSSGNNAGDDSQRASGSSTSSQQNRPRQDPSGGGGNQPRPPFFSEPDDPSLPSLPFRNPPVVGDRDLDPLGGAAPSLPSPFGGRQGGSGGGFGGVPPFPGGPGGMGMPDAGGGMYVGPNHPMFRDRFQGGGVGGARGGYGGMMPPGARYDPIGPGGMGGLPRPGGGGQRGPDVGGPLPQPGARRRDGEPDWDDVRPPGNNNGYDDMFM